MLYEATGLTRTFKGRTVLNLEHLAIESHAIYALIGPNGAGKTTLLNLLAFLDRPTTGTLQFRGLVVRYNRQQLLELRRRIVLVDQYPILFTSSVWKNVGFGLKVRGISKKLRAHRIEQALELVGMEQFRQADAHTLSGGETKRVALARALAIEPEVLLCDEPTANVDEENQEIILQILQRINREQRTSILLATHYLAQSRRLADHTLMLEHGTLSDPASENIYRCRVTRHDANTLCCQLPGGINLLLPHQPFAAVQEHCKVFINPQEIRFVAEQEKETRKNRLTGRITRVELNKKTVRITIDCGVQIHLLQTMQDYYRSPPLVGQEKTIALPDSGFRFSDFDSSY
ncbi:MAG: ATP-binding cassette domain-containing protein [Desulfobulbaceae bacterium]|nr:ATP-binding cassette domain-containing protein [Desulfobulbaceae bacterium]